MTTNRNRKADDSYWLIIKQYKHYYDQHNEMFTLSLNSIIVSTTFTSAMLKTVACRWWLAYWPCKPAHGKCIHSTLVSLYQRHVSTGASRYIPIIMLNRSTSEINEKRYFATYKPHLLATPLSYIHITGGDWLSDVFIRVNEVLSVSKYLFAVYIDSIVAKYWKVILAVMLNGCVWAFYSTPMTLYY